MSSAVLAGRFQILEHAGKGASGDVFRAHDAVTRRSVALKVLTGRPDHDAIERFSREVRLLSHVDDPHVVRYVAHGVDPDGRPYLAVDWLEGEDLAHRQRRQPLDGREALEVARQAAMGLVALHAAGIVHRDIKPANIFLSWTGRGNLHVTLIDLGIARSETSTEITRDGLMIGTPSYMSPEQVLGRDRVGFASDLFSLGVVLFELVSGERPYRADDVFGLVAKIALQEPPRLSAIVGRVPPELDEIVATAMAKEPPARFSSALELARALEVAPPFAVARTADRRNDEPTKTTGPLSLASVERRVVTTVFVRLASTTGASSAWAPFERITREAGGTPHKLLAIAFVAVFGAERSSGDEAHRAVRAALAIQRALPSAQMALATGRATAGVSGLAGDAIDRGVRLVESGSGIRVDRATARLVGEAFEVSEDGETLLGERIEGSAPRIFLGRATPCLGRDREIAQLEALFLEVAEDDVARAAIVIGEAGAGKSRVRHELQRRIAHHARAPRFLIARGSALGERSPFTMIGSAIRAFAGIQENEPVDARRTKLGSTIRDSAKNTLIPLLAQLASVDGSPSRGQEDGALASDQLRGTFEAWVAEVCSAAPLCIVLEDAHHGDAPSLRLVDGLLGNLADRPLFVLALARAEIDQRFPQLWSARAPTTLRLGKLSRRAGSELARLVLGPRASAAMIDGLVDRSGGNAFYLEELIRATTSRDDDTGTVSDLPDTVLGMVQARLDALGAASKRVLKAASVLGEVFWPHAVAAVLEDDADETAAVLRDLTTKEVLERRSSSRFQGQHELAFRHALLREAAYELLTDEDRKAGHERAATWLEATGERESGVLARHWERAGHAARAMDHFARAAEQALVGGDFDGAIEAAERALAYGAGATVRGRLLLTIAEARRWRGELEPALEAAAFAEEGLDPGSADWFAALREQVAARGRLGHKDRIGALAQRALATTAKAGADGSQIAALVPAAVHLLYGGERTSAEEIARKIETLTSRVLGLDPRARARVHQLRASLAQARDDHETAVREQEAALAQFVAANDRRAGALVSSNLGFAHYQLGALERAEEVLRSALATAKALGLGTIVPLAKQNLGAVLTRLGRFDDAQAVQREAVDAFAALKDPRLEGYSRIHLALVEIMRGDPRAAEHVVAPVVASGYEALHVGAHAALAMIRLAEGNATGAFDHAARARATLDRLGTVEEFEILSRVVLVDAALACGRLTEARTAAAAARARVDERANRIADAALRRSFLDRTPEIARLTAQETALARSV